MSKGTRGDWLFTKHFHSYELKGEKAIYLKYFEETVSKVPFLLLLLFGVIFGYSKKANSGFKVTCCWLNLLYKQKQS